MATHNFLTYVDGEFLFPIPDTSSLGGVDYVCENRTLDPYYSKHGFAFPLKFESISYESLLNNNFPVFPGHLNHSQQQNQWVLITHEGGVFIVDNWQGENGNEICFYETPVIKCGGGVLGGGTNKSEVVVGFIKVNKDKETLVNFVNSRAFFTDVELQWVSLKAIVEKLNRDFPKEPQNVTTTEAGV